MLERGPPVEAGTISIGRRLLEGRTASRVSLPTYAFERERYWARPAGESRLRRLQMSGRPSFVRQQQPLPSPTGPGATRGLRASASCSSTGSEAATQSGNYRLVLEAARFADEAGLSSVWIPERHFTRFSLYPNPATLHAAIARETTRASASWPAALSCRCTARSG